jgi:hypothetical protein
MFLRVYLGEKDFLMSERDLQFLTALREQLIAMVMLVDEYLDVPRGSEVVTDAGCQHPEDKRVNASRMGHRGFMCGVCNEIVEEPIA